MKNSQRGFIVPLLLVAIAVLVIGGAAYYYAIQKHVIFPPIENKTANQIQESMTETPQDNTIASETANWKTYKGSLVPGDYEDTSGTVNYLFNYPDTISVEISLDKRTLTLTDTISGKITTIHISYEGGRGYSPADMFNEQIKKTCVDCTIVSNKISVQGNTGLITVIGGGKEWLIFAPPTDSQWLVIASLSSSTDQTAERIISTFKFSK